APAGHGAAGPDAAVRPGASRRADGDRGRARRPRRRLRRRRPAGEGPRAAAGAVVPDGGVPVARPAPARDDRAVRHPAAVRPPLQPPRHRPAPAGTHARGAPGPRRRRPRHVPARADGRRRRLGVSLRRAAPRRRPDQPRRAGRGRPRELHEDEELGGAAAGRARPLPGRRRRVRGAAALRGRVRQPRAGQRTADDGGPVTRTDANGSTWFHLGTETDFLPAGGADAAFGPAFGPGVSYDPDRHVLELTSELPRRRRRSPPGLAVDPGGDLYLVAGGTLLVERCDGSRAPLPCEPGILRDPHGLALDRRGLLYVADRGARSVVVLQPDDGRVEARLEAPGLHEPVDVAIAPSGDVFVADRGGHDLIGLAAGRIWRFGARFELLGSWVPQDGAVPPRPLRPRPIAVLWDAGDVLVADEAHPRLLAFDAAGRPRLEREYTAAADE